MDGGKKPAGVVKGALKLKGELLTDKKKKKKKDKKEDKEDKEEYVELKKVDNRDWMRTTHYAQEQSFTTLKDLQADEGDLTGEGNVQAGDMKSSASSSSAVVKLSTIIKKENEQNNPQGSGNDPAKQLLTRGQPLLTESQKSFLIAQEKRMAEQTEKAVKLTHREKMDRFNRHLGALSEHFDIPRVGPG
ncbi:unnamed protein product [Amoebophrya sp. A120]|nr:unnamed protein product [Amoebophrya sp. A120]|eukprot:GSA120T00013942001.1